MWRKSHTKLNVQRFRWHLRLPVKFLNKQVDEEVKQDVLSAGLLRYLNHLHLNIRTAVFSPCCTFEGVLVFTQQFSDVSADVVKVFSVSKNLPFVFVVEVLREILGTVVNSRNTLSFLFWTATKSSGFSFMLNMGHVLVDINSKPSITLHPHCGYQYRNKLICCWGCLYLSRWHLETTPGYRCESNTWSCMYKNIGILYNHNFSCTSEAGIHFISVCLAKCLKHSLMIWEFHRS